MQMCIRARLYREALNHPFDEPKQWEIREINEIMNQCVTGWNYFSNPRMFPQYGKMCIRDRAYRPGCKFEVMLCLVGGQGAGKSTFFRLLAVRDEW